MALTSRTDRGFVWQTHPLYDEWYPTWKLAGEVYEGDGGFLDGTNLIAHPRELNYKIDRDGNIVPDQVISEKAKFTRRRLLARYENFAQSIIDILVDHQYAKLPTRSFDKETPERVKGEKMAPIEKFWEDVDGQGTNIDDWLKHTQTLANVYGHVHVLIDREYQVNAPRTRAEESPLRLRVYVPEDTLDWLAPRGKLTAIKFVEAVERESLREPSTFAENRRQSDTSTKDLPNVQFYFWDDKQFEVYDREGKQRRQKQHGFGELPVIPFYCRRRVRIPHIGRSALRDPKVYKDHFNLVSELRELLRGQTFSLLNVQLGEGEDVADAKGRMGNHAGVDTVLFTKGSATFIAPADGPVARYAQEIADLERKFYRLAGLPWENDSADAESEGSRKLKAMDMNRLLAGQADEAERFEYQLTKLFYIGYYGRDLGLQRLRASGLRIKHPDEFNIQQLTQAVTEAREAMSLNLGPTAEKLIKKGVITLVVPNATPEERTTIEQEIDKQPSQAELDDIFKEAMKRQSNEPDFNAEAEAPAA